MAYQKGEGYVGYGVVTSTAEPIHLFRLEDGATLAEALKQSDHNTSRPEEEWEYAVGVQWKKYFDLAYARRPREELYLLKSDPHQVNNVAAEGKHAEVKAFVTPEAFKEYEAIAYAKGFLMVSASPLTRSSYHAGDDFARLRAARRT